MQLLKLWQQHVVCLCDCCDVHDAWECVVAALALVHVVVWVHHLAAQLAAKQLNGPVGTAQHGMADNTACMARRGNHGELQSAWPECSLAASPPRLAC